MLQALHASPRGREARTTQSSMVGLAFLSQPHSFSHVCMRPPQLPAPSCEVTKIQQCVELTGPSAPQECLLRAGGIVAVGASEALSARFRWQAIARAWAQSPGPAYSHLSRSRSTGARRPDSDRAQRRERTRWQTFFDCRKGSKLEPALRRADPITLICPLPRSGAFVTSHQV